MESHDATLAAGELALRSLDDWDSDLDLFLIALGFEDRSPAIASSLARTGKRAHNAILLEYGVNQTENLRNFSEISQALDMMTNKKWMRVPFDTEAPMKNVENLRARIGAMNLERPRVGVDVSSLSSSAIFEVFSALSVVPGASIVVFYAEAGRYDHPQPSGAEKVEDEEYLSSGVRAIHTVPTFEGEYTPGLPPLLIIFLGYEEIRARGICERFPPSSRIAILARPSSPGDAARVDLERRLNRNVLKGSSRVIEAPSLDIAGVLEILEALHQEFSPTNNITVTPLGSKMQTLAILLFLRKHADVQLLISTPLRYHTHRYPEGVGPKHSVLIGSVN